MYIAMSDRETTRGGAIYGGDRESTMTRGGAIYGGDTCYV